MNPFNKLPLLTKRMNEIIALESIELDVHHESGDSEWIAVATIADMVEVRPAIYHPADRAEPAEYGPAVCSAAFTLTPDCEMPPMTGSDYDKIQFLDSLDLQWEIDDEND